MDKLLALFALLSSLLGCDGGRDTVVHRVTDAGVDLLLSRATIEDGSTRFDCVRSASGACHYVVLPTGCAAPERCPAASRRFDLAAGGSRRIAGLQAFRLCVGGGARIDASQCTASDRLGR